MRYLTLKLLLALLCTILTACKRAHVDHTEFPKVLGICSNNEGIHSIYAVDLLGIHYLEFTCNNG